VAAASMQSFGVQIVQIRVLAGSERALILCGTAVATLWNRPSGIRGFTQSKVVLLALTSLPLFLFFFGSYLDLNPCNLPAPKLELRSLSQPLNHHPIAELVVEARKEAATLKNNKLVTIDQARAQYQQDFDRDPPPGFDNWFQPGIKDGAWMNGYKTMTGSLDPFFSLSPAEVRSLVSSATKKENEIVLVSIRNGTFSTNRDGVHWLTTSLKSWLSPVPDYIPDVDFALNLLDEPRVVIPRRRLDTLKFGINNQSQPLLLANQHDGYQVHFLNVSRQNIWELATHACPTSSASQSVQEYRDKSLFVDNITQATDTCNNPSFKSLHGFYISPATALLTTQPVPIFSPTRPTSFQDILYPSPWYQKVYDQRNYKEKADLPWHEKENALYWAGRSTGGYALEENWHLQHRQRFVRHALCPNQRVSLLSQAADKTWRWVSSPIGRISNYLHLSITAAIQCSAVACMEQKRRFQVSRVASMSDAYKARLVMDLDGNGFSGRFYRLLESRSTVLKQTIFQEWHDDRLVPWAHYIPISTDMHELAETVRYLLETEEGQALSQRMAIESRIWARTVLRSVDLKIAFYRALLDYAWLVSDDRVA
jgi:hypothetical protein